MSPRGLLGLCSGMLANVSWASTEIRRNPSLEIRRLRPESDACCFLNTYSIPAVPLFFFFSCHFWNLSYTHCRQWRMECPLREQRPSGNSMGRSVNGTGDGVAGTARVGARGPADDGRARKRPREEQHEQQVSLRESQSQNRADYSTTKKGKRICATKAQFAGRGGRGGVA